MKSGNLDARLKLWGFERDFAILEDGSLTFILELASRDIAYSAEETVNGLVSQLGGFLNSLPAGTSFQFVQDICGGNTATIDGFVELSHGSTNEAATRMAAERAEKFRGLDKAGLLPKVRTYLLVNRPLTSSLVKKRGFFSRDQKFPEVAEAALERELHLAEALRSQVVADLAGLSVRARALPTEEIAALVYAQWNPGRSVGLGNFDGEDVRSHILFSDVEVSKRGFRIGAHEHRVVSLKLMPDQTIAGMSAMLGSLPFGSRLFVSIHVPDQQKELEGLQGARRLAYSMAAGKKSGVSDLESQAKLRDIESLLEEMISCGEKVFRVSLNIVLHDTDENVLEEKVAETLSTIRLLSGAEGMLETLASFQVFSELSLPNVKALERSRRLKTSNLADLIPLYAPWKGHERPSVLLRRRDGGLLTYDVADVSLSSGNAMVFGASGSGKSYLVNMLLLQVLKENAKLFFVDIGGSYKKLCDNLEGQYIPLGIGNGISFNPFDLGESEKAPSSQKIKFLLSLVELMTKEDGATRLPKLHRAEIEEAIARLYEAKPTPRLSDLRERLLAHDDTEIRRYGRILTTWCGDTPFGQFLDRETNLQLGRSLVAFDLKGMESYPDLQAVSLFIITDFVWREVQKDRATPKFLVFDECWSLLKDENDTGSAAFVESVYRTCRKYRCYAISLSQAWSDFAKSKIASAILPNCPIKWILMQSQIDYEELKSGLSLNDTEVNLIRSLRQDKGRYSEAFLIAGDNRSVAVIESTPLEYWIGTTDPRDLAAIDKSERTEPELSSLARLIKLSEQFPNGVAAHEADLQHARTAA